jgi:hypothetical protein
MNRLVDTIVLDDEILRLQTVNGVAGRVSPVQGRVPGCLE